MVKKRLDRTLSGAREYERKAAGSATYRRKFLESLNNLFDILRCKELIGEMFEAGEIVHELREETVAKPERDCVLVWAEAGSDLVNHQHAEGQPRGVGHVPGG